MNLKSSENIGKLTFRSVGMLLGTTAIAATVGIIVGNLFKLGVSDTVISSSVNQMKEITPVVDTLRNLLPSNPVQAMAEANIVAIVVFATFIGLAIKRLNNKHAQTIKPFVDFVEDFYKIITSVSITVIKFMPYAVVAMMANAIVGRGVSAIFDVIDFIIISSLGIAGIPGTAAMAVSVVISGVGMGAFFPYAGGILAIDPILDMGRTMLNVNGSMTSTVVVAKSLNKINKKE